MAKIDNITRGEFEAFVREVRRNQYATPLNNSSVSGGMRFYGAGKLRVENDGLEVIGSGTFTGTLYANGTVGFTGTFTQSGPSTFTGPTEFIGNVTATGDFATNGPTHLNGPTDVTGNLNVTGGGKVTAGGMTLDPAALDGKLGFSNGSYVAATPNGAQLAVPNGGAVYASVGQAGVAHGGIGIAVDASGPFVSGMPTTAQPANLYQDPATGRLYRSTA